MGYLNAVALDLPTLSGTKVSADDDSHRQAQARQNMTTLGTTLAPLSSCITLASSKALTELPPQSSKNKF